MTVPFGCVPPRATVRRCQPESLGGLLVFLAVFAAVCALVTVTAIELRGSAASDWALLLGTLLVMPATFVVLLGGTVGRLDVGRTVRYRRERLWPGGGWEVSARDLDEVRLDHRGYRVPGGTVDGEGYRTTSFTLVTADGRQLAATTNTVFDAATLRAHLPERTTVTETWHRLGEPPRN